MAREKAYLDLPIGIAFTTSDRKNAKVKVKVVRNRNIDELLKVNFVIPGIPAKAIIKEVVMGDALIAKVKEKYNIYN